MSDNLFTLYSQKILNLATQLPENDTLENADGSSQKRSPICGSQVSVSLALKEEKIARYAIDVKACALGQASSSLFYSLAIGRSEVEVQTLRHELAAFLAKEGDAPTSPFEEYEIFQPAQEHRNRHASILLVVDATLSAFDQAIKSRPHGAEVS